MHVQFLLNCMFKNRCTKQYKYLYCDKREAERVFLEEVTWHEVYKEESKLEVTGGREVQGKRHMIYKRLREECCGWS